MGQQVYTLRNIAMLFHALVGITFCSISTWLLSFTQVKTEASSKKMQLQEVIRKIKTQKKTFIHFSTKIVNFQGQIQISLFCSICAGFYGENKIVTILVRIRIGFKNLKKVKVETQIIIISLPYDKCIYLFLTTHCNMPNGL